MRVILIAILLVIGAGQWSNSAGEVQDFEVRKDTIIRNWRKVTAEELLSPENADVMAHFRRSVMRGSTSFRYRVLLLRAGDPETVHYCLEKLIQEPSIGGDFVTSGNAKLILALEAPLVRKESAKNAARVGGNEGFRIRPPSVQAAEIIRELIVSSAAFSPEVTDWARNVVFGPNDGEAGRHQIRVWVAVNKPVLETGNFAAARVPE